jgi:type II secretory pathway pseudopilin PulG
VTAPLTSHRRIQPGRLAVLAVAALLAVLLAVVLGRQRPQIDGLRRQQEQTGRQQQAACTVFADVGDPGLLRPDSSVLAKKIINDAGQAARILGCR